MPDNLAVIVLAGGSATRLPGKLALPIGGRPMLLAVVENVRGEWPTYVSASATLSEELRSVLGCPFIEDRWSGRGPLGGMLSAMPALEHELVFVAAGDAPRIRSALIAATLNALEPGDEAVVPVHGSPPRREPLAALYRRAAFLREARPAFERGEPSVLAIVERLKTRLLPVADETVFANVNDAGAYAAMSA